MRAPVAEFTSAGSALDSIRRGASGWLFRAGLFGPFLRWADRDAPERRCLQILTYHRVNDDAHPFFAGVPVADFEAQMRLVARYFSVLGLEDAVERMKSRRLPARALAITFDDGYRDNYDHAFPVLLRLGLPATIFLATGAIERRESPWHDRVFEAFRSSAVRTLRVGDEEWPLCGIEDKRRGLAAFMETARSAQPERRSEMIDDLLVRLDVKPEASEAAAMLDWPQIREMAQAGIDFGAHTVSHTIVTKLAPPRARQEIFESKRTIEERLGRSVALFAYPNGARGDFDEATRQFVRDAGYGSAVTTVWGTNDAESDPFELRRVGIWGADPRPSLVRLALERRSTRARRA